MARPHTTYTTSVILDMSINVAAMKHGSGQWQDLVSAALHL